MRNTELEKLDGLVGEWATTLSDARSAASGRASGVP